MKKLSIFFIILAATLLFSGCAATGEESINETREEIEFIKNCEDLGGRASAYGFSLRKNHCYLESK